MLADLIPAFATRSKERRGHTLDNIETVLRKVDSPPGSDGLAAFEVFSGYLVLDALVANQDRHEENWAVVRPLPDEGRLTLAGSYDHGSSLGFNLTDSRRQILLERGDVPVFAAKARAHRFERASDGQLTLVELAHEALRRCSGRARARWRASLAGVSDDHMAAVVRQIPGLSDPARTFAAVLLRTNRGRLLCER